MLEVFFMSVTLLFAGRFVNKGIKPRGAFTASSAFLIGSWFFIVLNAFLTEAGFAEDWGKRLLNDYPGLYTQTIAIAAIGTIFFTLGAFLALKPRAMSNSTFAIVPLRKKDKSLLLIVAVVFFIPGNWAAVYVYQEAINSSFWDRTTSLVSISNLIVPAALISVVGVITSVKKGIGSLLFFGILLAASLSGLMLIWSRRAVLGVVFVLVMVIYARKHGKPSPKVLKFLFPVLGLGAVFLAFYRVSVFFGYSTETMTIMEVMESYLTDIWLESSAFAALMYSAGPALEGELLWGSSFLAAFIFYIPRAIFPDKPLSYDLGMVISGDLEYNLPASFYGEVIANFGMYSVPIASFILGYFIKKIDYKFYSKPRNVFEVAIYLFYIFNMFFMIRGSFSTVISAIVIMCVLPLVAYYILIKIFRVKRDNYLYTR